MISRRNYISITIMMVTVLFLCMCLNNLKDGWNDYAVNRYTETAENYPSKVNIYVPDGSEEKASGDGAEEDGARGSVVGRDRVACIGSADGMTARLAEEWVSYTKRDIAFYPTLTECEAGEEGAARLEMLVIDSACVDWEGEMDFLTACLEEGIHLVFGSLPDVSVIRGNAQVRDLLGIGKVRQEEADMSGFYLREGFLLGGEAFYLERESPESDTFLRGSEAFPGERTLPWYTPAPGTKVYMKGIPEESGLKSAEYPMILWRKSFKTAYVFVVNGSFMEGPQGLGLLSAMAAEMDPYEIYPVLNAQNLILAGYPSLADENAEEMDRRYSRSVRQVFQELLWPGVSVFLEKYEYKATCMLTPQYDYSDDNLPDGKQMKYYLKIFNEHGAETGLSALNVSELPVAQKLREDDRFFQEALGGYAVASFYAGDLGEEQIMEALQTEALASARTVVREYDPEAAPVEFLSEDVTAQRTMGSGLEYTYRTDFLVRCMETALGYFSMDFDMSRVAYPEDEAGDGWEQLSRTFASTVGTYGQQFPGFARTTAAECDTRIRRFLAMDYSCSRTDDTIRLELEEATGPVWFILRTHNEAVREMEGGSWLELEEGAYLIEASDSDVTLVLEPTDERFYK